MSEVSLERRGPIATVTIDRPAAKNAIDRAAMRALEEIVGELEADTSVACTILTGGGGSFVSGGDLKDFAQLEKSEEGRRMSLWMQSVLGRFEALPCPTIAALDGDAHGGGCEIALACDMRVIASSSSFIFRQVAMGLTPGWGGGQRLLRLVGRSRAIRIFCTAATVGAEEALAIGLVDRVAPKAMDEARGIAERIAEQPALAVRNTKRAILRGSEMPLRAAIDFEAELFAQTWGSEDHRAAVEAFLLRRR
jgi:enoyl-CoA hydratase